MNFGRKGRAALGLLAAASAAITLAGCASDTTAPADASDANIIFDRSATGDVTTHGGARRVDGDQSEAIRDAINTSGAKNVILLIGDGMGDSEITAARNVAVGAGGAFQGLDALPFTGQYTHYSLDRETGKPDYVTDSAASGSAWSTGTKTYNGAISVDINGEAQQTLLEKAKEAELATGVVTTSEIQDATPAVQYSHVTERGCYGPEATSEMCADNALENGGAGSITEQMLETRPDLVLGGGAETFDETAAAGEYEGKTLMEQATERGYQIVEDATSLNGIEKADQDAPLLGLFAPGNMEVRWTGDFATQGGIPVNAPTASRL